MHESQIQLRYRPLAYSTLNMRFPASHVIVCLRTLNMRLPASRVIVRWLSLNMRTLNMRLPASQLSFCGLPQVSFRSFSRFAVRFCGLPQVSFRFAVYRKSASVRFFMRFAASHLPCVHIAVARKSIPTPDSCGCPQVKLLLSLNLLRLYRKSDHCIDVCGCPQGSHRAFCLCG